VPPGGGAFANIDALSELSIALKQELVPRIADDDISAAELAWTYDQIALDKEGARREAFDLAKASVFDPRNPELLHNLGVLFRYAGDAERAALAQRLASEARPN
jgi:hypothetical protein